MATDSSEGLAVLSYLAVVSRWKWLIVGVMLACLAAGLVYLYRSTPLYRATAKLLYVQPVTISNPLIQGSYSQSYEQPDIATVSAMVASSQVTEATFDLLEGRDTSAGYWIEASRPVDSSGNSSEAVVGIDAASSNAQTAQDAANATAQAFVDWRRDGKTTQVEEALAAVQAALKTYATPAAQESAEYLQLRQSEQALELQLESLSSDFTIIAPATLPTEPFSPRKRHTIALAGSLGLMIGIVLAFLLEQLDTRVRDERQMTEMMGMSALGHLPPLGRRVPEGGGVHMLTNPSGPMAEAIRVLRGNLSFTGIDGDVRSLVITSSIRSEGKSVTAANLAVSLALAGQRVVLVDADFRRPRIHTYMRVSNVIGLSSVLARRAKLSDAVIPISLEIRDSSDGGIAVPDALVREGPLVRVMSAVGGESEAASASAQGYSVRRSTGAPHPGADVLLGVLPSGPLPPNPGEMAASLRFGEIIEQLAGTAEVVIIDTPPLLEVGDTAAMASKVDGLVFVANMGRVRWPMLERCRAQLEKFPCRKLGMVIVAAKRAHRAAYGYEYRYASSPRGAAPPADPS